MSKTNKSHSKLYIKVWLGLLALTALTVTVSYFDFGSFNILVATLVATVKAALVILFFMHLIDDNRLNQVVFMSSFVFLALFVGLTASDVFFRDPVYAGNDDKAVVAAQAEETEKTAAPAATTDWSKSTPELIATGAAVYAKKCSLCHGTKGAGDGVAASALTPKPRNFLDKGKWTVGKTPADIYRAIKEGVPGTGMSAYATMADQERWGLVHHITQLMQAEK